VILVYNHPHPVLSKERLKTTFSLKGRRKYGAFFSSLRWGEAG